MPSHRALVPIGVALGMLLAIGCATAPSTTDERASLEVRADAALQRLRETDPAVSRFFNSAKGYAVFPAITKGGAGLGGAFGRGLLFEGGRPVGYVSVTQGTIGFQLGGQAFSEVIFFENEPALRNLKDGNLEFAAQASAVAAAAGTSAAAKYEQGVAVFVLGEKGLMYEAAIGGQKFSYQPK